MNYEGPRLGPVNLGNPSEYTIANLAALILKMTKSKSRLVFQPARSDDPYRRQPDIQKANHALKWSPTVTLEMGIDRTIAYFQQILKEHPNQNSV